MAAKKPTSLRPATAQHGAAAFKALIHQIREMGNADLEGRRGDTRDYHAMAAVVLASVDSNLRHPDADRAEGYLRALVHLLSLEADGCGIGDGNGWNPIRLTAPAFARAEKRALQEAAA